MNKKDLVLSFAWASALFVSLALMVVGPHTLATIDLQQLVALVSASFEHVGIAVAMLLLSGVGGIALHGRFTARFTKSS